MSLWLRFKGLSQLFLIIFQYFYASSSFYRSLFDNLIIEVLFVFSDANIFKVVTLIQILTVSLFPSLFLPLSLIHAGAFRNMLLRNIIFFNCPQSNWSLWRMKNLAQSHCSKTEPRKKWFQSEQWIVCFIKFWLSLNLYQNQKSNFSHGTKDWNQRATELI